MSSSLLKHQWLQILTHLQPAVIKWETKEVGQDPLCPWEDQIFLLRKPREVRRYRSLNSLPKKPHYLLSASPRPHPKCTCQQDPRVSLGSMSYTTLAYICCNLWKWVKNKRVSDGLTMTDLWSSWHERNNFMHIASFTITSMWFQRCSLLWKEAINKGLLCNHSFWSENF